MTKKLILISSMLLASCGGGSGGSSNDQPSPNVLEGVFIDSPVMGLAYSTATQSGLTDSSGTFTYLAGETVSFSLGGIQFGSATGGSEITPLDLVGAPSFDEADLNQRNTLTNILILLQSLDADQNPDNGIDLADLDGQLSDESIDFDASVEEFVSGRYLRLVAEAGGIVVEEKQALNHFFESVDASITIDLPVFREQDTDGDGVIDIETVYEYEADGSPKRVTVTRIASSIISEDFYEYNDSGLLAKKTIGLGSTFLPALNSGPGSFLTPPFSFEVGATFFEYNDRGQILSVRKNPESDSPVEIINTYDEFGRLLTKETRSIFQETFIIGFPVPFTPAGITELKTNAYEDSLSESKLVTHSASHSDTASLPEVELIDAAIEVVSYPLTGALQTPPLSSFTLPGLDILLSSDPIELIELERFHYSDQGYINQVDYSQSRRVLTDAISENFVEETRTYDSAGRLIHALAKTMTDEIETRFSFSDTGRLNSCSVSINGEKDSEIQNAEEADATVNESYSYTGYCRSLNLVTQTFSDTGLLLAMEVANLRSSLSGAVESISQRIEYNYDNEQLSSVIIDLLNGAFGAFEQTIELSADGSSTRTLDSQGQVLFTDQITTEQFVLKKLPAESIQLRLAGAP